MAPENERSEERVVQGRMLSLVWQKQLPSGGLAKAIRGFCEVPRDELQRVFEEVERHETDVREALEEIAHLKAA